MNSVKSVLSIIVTSLVTAFCTYVLLEPEFNKRSELEWKKHVFSEKLGKYTKLLKIAGRFNWFICDEKSRKNLNNKQIGSMQEEVFLSAMPVIFLGGKCAENATRTYLKHIVFNEKAWGKEACSLDWELLKRELQKDFNDIQFSNDYKCYTVTDMKEISMEKRFVGYIKH